MIYIKMSRSLENIYQNYKYLTFAYLRRNGIITNEYESVAPSYDSRTNEITYPSWNLNVPPPEISDLENIPDSELNNEKKGELQSGSNKEIFSLFKSLKYPSYTRIASFSVLNSEKIVGAFIQIVSDTTNQTFSIKLYDKTNKVNVLESTSLSVTSQEKLDMGFVEYTPSSNAIIEVQFKNTSITKPVYVDHISIYKK
jgi:hypothetical protein